MAVYDGSATVAGVAPSGNIYQLVVPSKNGSYDGDMVTMQYKTLTINSGVTLTTDQPCRGMMLYVQGNCTITGTLSMNARGPLANPTASGGSDSATVHASGLRFAMRTASGSDTLSAANFAGSGSPAVALVAHHPATSSNGTIFTCAVPTNTQNGHTSFQTGTGHNTQVGATGLTTTNGAGGGGAGGCWAVEAAFTSYGGSPNAGSGGCATPWGGGSGGGGINGGGGSTFTPNQGVDYGGAGGIGRSNHTARCGGGTGNPHGTNTHHAGYPAGSSETDPGDGGGTGGAIWLIVGGNLTITGSITAKGSKGWDLFTGNNGWCCGGGASGGGNIRIAYKGTLSDSGTKLVTGGIYSDVTGTGGYSNDGAAGGAGTSVLAQVL